MKNLFCKVHKKRSNNSHLWQICNQNNAPVLCGSYFETTANFLICAINNHEKLVDGLEKIKDIRPNTETSDDLLLCVGFMKHFAGKLLADLEVK